MLGLLTDVGRNGTAFYTVGMEHLGVPFVEEKLPTEEIIDAIQRGEYVKIENAIEIGLKNLKAKGCDHVAIACMSLQGMTGHVANRLGLTFVNPCSYLDEITGNTSTGIIASSLFLQQYSNPNWKLLPDHLQKHVDRAVWSMAMEKGFPADIPFREINRYFDSQGVECILIACTDLTEWCHVSGNLIWTKGFPTKHLLMLAGKRF